MAISYIGGQTQDKAGGLDLTFTVPASTTTDDFMVVFVKQCENTTQQTWDDDGGGGNGWTREVYNRTTGGRDMECAIYWKFATSGSEPNPTFTWASGITSEPMSGAIEVYRGVDKNSPFTAVTYLNAQNDANPPNPSVPIDNANSWVVCFHGATHDDITATAPPTGFTMRDEVWNGTSDDHRNIFVADISGIGVQASYSPPDWQHTVANTTPEYQTYSMALNEVQPIGIITHPATAIYGETGLITTGFGFEATQATGKVELWSDTSGTIKTTQTITSWADASITFTAVQGSLPDNTTVYIVVTNDTGDVSSPKAMGVGLVPYEDAIIALNPDHLWMFDGNYNDTGVGGATRNATSGVVGTHPFEAGVCDGSTNSMRFNAVTDRREIADSSYMNITISSKERTVAFWFMLLDIDTGLVAIWKEGGGVQNLAFITGLGGAFMFQLADTAGTRDNVQSTAETKLRANRPFHATGTYTHLATTKESRLWIDGRVQPIELTDGNPMTLGIFDSHSGDVTWNDPDTTLETGTTDIAYNGSEFIRHNAWCSWSDNSTSGGLVSASNIKEILFRRGAPPLYTIDADTVANMQSDFATQLTDVEVADYPLGIRFDKPTDSSNLTINAEETYFNALTTEHIEWRGDGTLTYITGLGSGLDSARTFSTLGGTITIQTAVPVRVTVKDFNTGAVIQNARVRMTAGAGGSETLGDVILEGLTSVGGVLAGTLVYSIDQPVTGRVRRATTGTLYKTTDISDTITSNGLDITLLMIPDE